MTSCVAVKNKFAHISAGFGARTDQLYLGDSYYHGKNGLTQNYKKAYFYFSSIEKKSDKTYEILGDMNRKGEGIKKSLETSIISYRNCIGLVSCQHKLAEVTKDLHGVNDAIKIYKQFGHTNEAAQLGDFNSIFVMMDQCTEKPNCSFEWLNEIQNIDHYKVEKWVKDKVTDDPTVITRFLLPYLKKKNINPDIAKCTLTSTKRSKEYIACIVDQAKAGNTSAIDDFISIIEYIPTQKSRHHNLLLNAQRSTLSHILEPLLKSQFYRKKIVSKNKVHEITSKQLDQIYSLWSEALSTDKRLRNYYDRLAQLKHEIKYEQTKRSRNRRRKNYRRRSSNVQRQQLAVLPIESFDPIIAENLQTEAFKTREKLIQKIDELPQESKTKEVLMILGLAYKYVNQLSKAKNIFKSIKADSSLQSYIDLNLADIERIEGNLADVVILYNSLEKSSDVNVRFAAKYTYLSLMSTISPWMFQLNIKKFAEELKSQRNINPRLRSYIRSSLIIDAIRMISKSNPGRFEVNSYSIRRMISSSFNLDRIFNKNRKQYDEFVTYSLAFAENDNLSVEDFLNLTPKHEQNYNSNYRFTTPSYWASAFKEHDMIFGLNADDIESEEDNNDEGDEMEEEEFDDFSLIQKPILELITDRSYYQRRLFLEEDSAYSIFDEFVDSLLEKSSYAREKVLNLAKVGNPRAQFLLSVVYRLGVGVPKDSKLAHEWLIKAAKNGSVRAQHNLGMFYQKDDPNIYNPELSHSWLILAASQGLHDSQYTLGLAYRDGKNSYVKSDYLAQSWLSKAAIQGHAEALGSIGLIFYKRKQRTLAFSLIKRSAELNSQNSMSNLAAMYDRGHGTKQDPKKANEWRQKYLDIYRKDAKNGDATAMHNLGFLYYDGQRVNKDISKATEWFKKAIKFGFVKSSYNLGVIYYTEDSIKDVNQAIKYFQMALDNGNDHAALMLGIIYNEQKNYKLAEKFFKVSIQKNNLGHANLELAKIYFQKHLKASPKTILSLLISALNSGVDESKYFLSQFVLQSDSNLKSTIESLLPQNPDYALTLLRENGNILDGSAKSKLKLKLLKKVAKVSPDNQQLQELLDNVLFGEGYKKRRSENKVSSFVLCQIAMKDYGRGCNVKVNLREARKWCKQSYKKAKSIFGMDSLEANLRSFCRERQSFGQSGFTFNGRIVDFTEERCWNILQKICR